MTRDSLLNRDWAGVVEWLGGAAALESSARETKAFQRPRAFKCAVDMLSLVLAYCVGAGGSRSVAAWAAAIGLVDISNVGLLYRLRRSGDWLSLLISRMLADAAPKPAQGRLIRLVDATVVAKAGRAAKRKNAVWRIHSAFEFPSERFGYFELTDEKGSLPRTRSGGERLDHTPVTEEEIRIGDRAYIRAVRSMRRRTCQRASRSWPSDRRSCPPWSRSNLRSSLSTAARIAASGSSLIP
jgi:hypothetical protein